MLFDRFGLRFGLHFGIQTRQEMDQTKQWNFEPILNGFWEPLGSTLRQFWPPKINEKTSLLQGPLQGRPMDAKRLQNDAKMLSKSIENEGRYFEAFFQ